MEIDITTFFNSMCPSDLSASIAEIGSNAGPDTWQAAKDKTEQYLLLDTDEKRTAAIAYFSEFGAWHDLEEWPTSELNALLLQDIAGTMRELLPNFGDSASAWDWEEYENQCQAGQVSGGLFPGDKGQVYFYLGH